MWIKSFIIPSPYLGTSGATRRTRKRPETESGVGSAPRHAPAAPAAHILILDGPYRSVRGKSNWPRIGAEKTGAGHLACMFPNRGLLK
jgi:hypothetical protein